MSFDAGATFVETVRLPAGTTLAERSWVMVADDDTILVGVELDTGALAIARSSDRGGSWAVDASFGDSGTFATATITPTGRIVVLATIDGADAPRRDAALYRDDTGTWRPIGTEA